MKPYVTLTLFAVVAVSAFTSQVTADDRFASRVVSSANLQREDGGPGRYGHPEAVLGKPTLWVDESQNTGKPNELIAPSLVYSVWSPVFDAPPAVAELGYYAAGVNHYGEIVVEFETPIVDDPRNWGDKDFIIFGNSILRRASGVYITSATNMETAPISTSALPFYGEPVRVSVSPDLENWYTYPSPTADGLWPMNTFAWDWTNHKWGYEQDWTKPVDNNAVYEDFPGKYVADALEYYKGSAGGTAYDLAPSGFQSIRYIKVAGEGTVFGDIDGFVRVSRPYSIAEVKRMEDGVTVSLGPQIVTAGTMELGDCFYIESQDRSCGIKATCGSIKPENRIVERGKLITLTGVLATVNGEREIQATWLEQEDGGPITPLGLPNRCLGGGPYGLQEGVVNGTGLNNIGLLVRTWGKVISRDPGTGTFAISDGSADAVKCAVPPGIDLPSQDIYVTVTGISSCEAGMTPLIRVRDSNDIQ